MDLKLKNRRALITGASRGLGFATARALSLEGALVAINGRDEARIQSAVLKLSSKPMLPKPLKARGMPASMCSDSRSIAPGR